MPCSDGGPNYQDNPETKRRLDLATRLLCSLCRKITNSGRDTLIYDDVELVRWWNDHLAADRKREKAEEAEREVIRKHQAALNKLTPEDRKVLGLDK
jgi:hypothetical protein